MATRMLICLVVSALLNLAGPAYHTCQAEEDEQAKAAAHLKHFLAKIELVVSGECDVTMTSKASAEQAAVTNRFVTAFDRAQARSLWRGIADGQFTECAVDGEMVSVWNDRTNVVSQYSLGDAKTLPRNGLPLDVRYAGLAGLWPIEARRPFEDYQEKVLAVLKPVSCRVVGDAAICSFSRGDNMRYTWRFDSKLDGMPSEFTVEFAAAPDKPFQQVEKVNVAWERHDKAWVPTVWKLTGSEGARQIAAELHWKSVNAPLPAKTFDYRTFGFSPEGLERGALVVDHRTTPPTATRHLLPGIVTLHRD